MYSLSFKENSGYPAGFAGACSWFENSTYKNNAANVRIVNIPWGPDPPVAPPYYFYLLPPNNTELYASSCDVLFDGGVPERGSTYFSFAGLSPSQVRWTVTRKNVVPSLDFRPPSPRVKLRMQP